MPSPRQTPTYSANVSLGTYSDGDAVCRLASAFFGDPLEWQRQVVSEMTARDSSDKYANPVYALAVPRQNGKSWITRARCFYGLITMGESILYTCQNGDTADEMFKAITDIFESEDNEELHQLLAKVSHTNGKEHLELTNGGYLRVTTRTNSLARGRSYDVLIYDEAQDLTKAQQAASLPTISSSGERNSRSTHNSQTIYLGTPPGPESKGTVFAHMHDDVHAGKKATPWVEWAAGEIGDPADRSRWYECNPGLGTVVSVDAVESEAMSMDDDEFARERLGWWTPRESADPALDRDLWDDAEVGRVGDEYSQKVAFGVKFSPDGSAYALAGCKLGEPGAAIELIRTGTAGGGTMRLAQWLAKRKGRAACVVVDGRSMSDALCENLRLLGAPKTYVVRPKSGDVVAAAQMAKDALDSGKLVHTGQEALTRSATGSEKRQIGSQGGWGFGSTATADSGPIEAASLALWGARTSKRHPGRKQRRL